MALALALGACVIDEPLPHRTTSLRIAVEEPTDLGTAEARLEDGLTQARITVQALDQLGRIDGQFNGSVDVYIQTLNSLSDQPAHLALSAGRGAGTVALPKIVFGATVLWLEDLTGDAGRLPTFATGTSPVFWFREPLLKDISTPDLTAPSSTWLRRSPLEGRQVRISSSEHGDAGRLIVTGVYADGFSVSDVDCGSLPCVAQPFAHVYVFSFSRPIDIKGRPVQVGQTLRSFEGGVAEFNGFTELNFPVQELVDATIDETLLPEPTPIEAAWLQSGNDQGLRRLEENESALMQVSAVTVCPLDSDYERFQQWKVDVGQGCGRAVNVISASTVATFDPQAFVGQRLTRIVGALRAVNLGSFNVWILLPRRAADIVPN
jgi:hypothetical protein